MGIVRIDNNLLHYYFRIDHDDFEGMSARSGIKTDFQPTHIVENLITTKKLFAIKITQ